MIPWCLAILAFALLAPSLDARQKKAVTMELAMKSPPLVLTKPLPSIPGWKDDGKYLLAKKKEGGEAPVTVIVDAKSGKELGEKEPDVRWDDFKSVVTESLNIARPLVSDKENLRHLYAKDNDLFLLDIGKKEFRRLTRSAAEELNPTFSPDGKTVAFTREGNLYTVDCASGAETQYTSDGSDVVYNGRAAWLYYEEIFGRPTRYQAYWWSPDSRRIAFYRFDESNVPMFPIYNSKGQHGMLERTRYPKAGDPNPKVRVGFAELESRKVVWANYREEDDQYFGTPFWTPGGKSLWVQWMNRGQDTLLVQGVDPATGERQTIYRETSASWVDWLEGINFLAGGRGFLIKSDMDGWTHLYRYAMDGKLEKKLTDGAWSVANIEYVDEHRGVVFFTARKEASTRTDLYSVKLDGGAVKRLTFGPYTHSVRLSPEGSYFLTTYSNVATPAKMALCTSDGKLLRELGDSYQKDLGEYDLAATSLITIPTADGYKLPALLTLPPALEPGKKYPVLISVYGGPGSMGVADGWRLSMQSQALATEGLIQLSVDHRGSGHFGKQGIALMYRNLGKWEMNDYEEAVKWLRAQPYVDSAKVCITGGSYGGYVTAMALTAGADYFTHGIANYSVTDWKLYDSHYTERYMDTPAENPEGYKAGAVVTYASRYKGMLRIVHGSTDDNVHVQNSLQLVDTLENLDRHFEFMIYPNERHGWGPPKSDHSRMESMRFYYTYLLEKKFPEALFAKSSQPGRERPH
jgi:dipeptidyl-peptidase-4